MKINKVCLSVLLFQIACGAYAQSGANISGLWKGTVQVPLGEDILGEYFFSQSGLHVTGHVRLKSLDGKDSSKYEFTGSIKQGIIHVRGIEFEYRTSLACLAVMELQYIRDNNQEKLIGKWRGDMRLSTCPRRY